MNIPDEAVEAAVATYLGLGYPGSYAEDELTEIQADVRRMLEAALPFLRQGGSDVES